MPKFKFKFREMVTFEREIDWEDAAPLPLIGSDGEDEDSEGWFQMVDSNDANDGFLEVCDRELLAIMDADGKAITPGEYNARLEADAEGDEEDDLEQAVSRNMQLRDAAPVLLTALRRLLNTTELNMDDMEPETRSAVVAAMAILAPFPDAAV